MSQFYVYGLIDPRKNSIFYIGKGKGKRVFQHATEKEEIHSNTEKLKIIKEIQKAGLEAEHTIIAEKLSEETALLLERLLIYRIGRSIFDEGGLTNIVPGGLWHKDAPLFIKKESLMSIKTIQVQYPELVPILEKYPHVAKEFTGLKCPIDREDENLYVFDNTGKKLHVWNISYFVQIFGLGHALDLINILKDSPAPIYSWNRIWSKSNYEFVENTSRIPFEDFDILDFDFIHKINTSLLEKKELSLDCFYQNGKKLGEVNISNNASEVSLTYYYPNGNKKHLTKHYEQKLNGRCLSWHSNGQLKEQIEYDQNKPLSKWAFYPSGNVELIENYKEDGTVKSVRIYYDNGQVRFENNEDGTSFIYSETGILLSKGIRTGSLLEGVNLLTWEYSEDEKVKKETRLYYINGILHGYEKSFYDTGELKREVDYTNGYNKKIIKTYKKKAK